MSEGHNCLLLIWWRPGNFQNAVGIPSHVEIEQGKGQACQVASQCLQLLRNTDGIVPPLPSTPPSLPLCTL